MSIRKKPRRLIVAALVGFFLFAPPGTLLLGALGVGTIAAYFFGSDTETPPVAATPVIVEPIVAQPSPSAAATPDAGEAARERGELEHQRHVLSR